MEKEKTASSTSTLSRNVKIDGEIQGAENLHIEGYIKGSIKLDGSVFVGQTGVVEADMEADSVVIEGKVTGKVMARKQLEIHSSGQLIGDCSARSIDIKEGAMFEGRSIMLKASDTPASGSPFGQTPAKAKKV
jgi:cytoskeletal protein CcmA (bactofilin family)